MQDAASQPSASWTANSIWIQDQWTEEDKSHARNRLQLIPRQLQQEEEEERRRKQKQAFGVFSRFAACHWNIFYEHNKTNFFKDRHYLHKAFPNEFGWLYHSSHGGSNHAGVDGKNNTYRIVEVGCGCGNAILPLLEQHSELMKQYSKESTTQKCNNNIPILHIHCLDFAPTAIQLLREDARFQSVAKEGRGTAHVYDLTSMHPSTIEIGDSKVLKNSADVAILLFCLSAVGPHPSTPLNRAARHLIDMLKPGGTLVIRDYGRLDEAQMKLGSDNELGNNFYRKGDGTGCYYFELEDLKDLFVNGKDDKLELLELDYIHRVYRNRGDDTTRRRVWIQGRFRKPVCNESCKLSSENVTMSADTKLKNILNTLVERWNNYYFVTSAHPMVLPSNLLQIFPNEFLPWQLPKKRGKRHRTPHTSQTQFTLSAMTIFDLGCGTGNDTLLNIVETQQLSFEDKQHPNLQDHQTCQSQPSSFVERSNPPILNVYFIDASNIAIDKLRSDPRYQRATAVVANGSTYNQPRCTTAATITSQVCDIASSEMTSSNLNQSANIILLLFTLSAIGPSGMINAVQNASRMLQSGGVILFRDYARYDDDQLRKYYEFPQLSFCLVYNSINHLLFLFYLQS